MVCARLAPAGAGAVERYHRHNRYSPSHTRQHSPLLRSTALSRTRTAVQILPAQLETFRKALGKTVRNFRPTQPLNGRSITWVCACQA